jgi:hypothetical protein
MKFAGVIFAAALLLAAAPSRAIPPPKVRYLR